MRLEKRYINIRNAVFDNRTYVENHTLHINKAELFQVVKDYRFDAVNLDIALPGTSCRLTNVGDAVQPVYKIDGPTFPGMVDGIGRVGSGSTVVLQGITVAEVCEAFVPLGCMIDMSGPGAEHTELAHTCIVAINPTPAKDASDSNYFTALNMASLRAAIYLAEAAADCEPDSVEVFQHLPLKDSELPRVAYIFQVFSHAPLTDLTFYGDSCHSMLPIIVHPNEILDGALCNRNYRQLPNADPTYLYQNHPMVLELLERHGKDINFAGIIMSNAPAQVEDKRRNALLATGLAKNFLKADAVIITKEGGGHPQIDIQLNCEMSEALGMKSVILISEFLSLDNSSNEVVIFNSKAADAMVSSGCLQKIELPVMEKVIGKTKILDPSSSFPCEPGASFIHENRYMRGSLSQLGGTNYTSVVY
jgi:glycine reductase